MLEQTTNRFLSFPLNKNQGEEIVKTSINRQGGVNLESNQISDNAGVQISDNAGGDCTVNHLQ
jgi:hypothetical protein